MAIRLLTTRKAIRFWILILLLISFSISLLQLRETILNYGGMKYNQNVAKSWLSDISKNNEESMDVFCLDRYGEPITRGQVLLTKESRVRKNVSLVIGMPTIWRSIEGQQAFYLTNTIGEIFKRLSVEEQKEILIIVFCADQDYNKRSLIIEKIRKEFQEFITNGTIQIIYAPKRFYSRLENLPRTYNDSDIRVKWRSKQTLDYVFMFYYVAGFSEFYLHLEDDLTVEEGFYQTIKNDIRYNLVADKSLNMISYYYQGFIGKLIKSDILIPMADFWRIFYYEMPLDWSYLDFLTLINYEDQEGSRVLFNHIGHQSSSNNL